MMNPSRLVKYDDRNHWIVQNARVAGRADDAAMPERKDGVLAGKRSERKKVRLSHEEVWKRTCGGSCYMLEEVFN